MRLSFYVSLPFMIIPGLSALATDFAQASAVLEKAITDGAFPGCAVAAGNRDGILWSAGLGHHDYEARQSVSAETIYDLASLTKVVGTTTVLMRLVALGKVDLSEPVVTYLPEFSSDPSGPENRTRQTITVADLLRHEGGLPSWKPFYRTVATYSELLNAALSVPLESAPGKRYRYSDIGFILLGEVAARAGRKQLPELERELVFEPLGMKSTGRNPPESLRDHIPPTERWANRDGFVHGVVHDENARVGEGITGHAGLFATAPDLALLAGELLRGWEGKSRLFPKEVMEQFSGRQSEDRHRGLGWALSSGSGSGGSLLSPSAFGHTGFTGTSLWIDPAQDFYIILLTNRVHPTRDNQKIGRVRASLADAAVRDLIRHAEQNTDLRTGADRNR